MISTEPETSIQDRLTEAISADGISQGELAKQLGISSSAVSQWRRGMYPGDADGIAQQVEKWLATRRDRKELSNILPPDPEYVETPTSRRILGVYKYTHARGGMALIYGGAGVCKSYTMAHYAQGRRNVISVTATPASSKVGPFLGKVCEAMEIEAISRKAPDREGAITAKARQIGHVLLIIDEAQYLPVETFYEITMLREESRVDGAMQLAIVLQGNEQIYSKAKAGFAQLYSRIGKRLKLTGATDGDLDAVLGAWERQQGLPAGYLMQHDIRSFLGHIASQDGGLRNVSETLCAAFFIAGGDNEPLSISHLRKSWADQGGGK